MSGMVVIVPTRSRPHNMGPMIESIEATKALDTRFVLSIDHDDPDIDGYQRFSWPEWATLEVTHPRMRLGEALNYHAQRLCADYDIIGFLGDDNRPITVGWDWRITDEMRPLGIVYCNDLIQRWKLPTAVFMDATIVRTVGYFSAPGVIHLYIDDAWKALGVALGTLRYLGDCVIEHRHPLVGKAESDAIYESVNSPERWSTDGPAFDKWRAEQLPVDSAKLHGLPDYASPFAF